MTRKKNIHVVPHSNGGWATKKEGTGKAGSVHKTQQGAIERAREQAIRERSEVITHRKNGQIRDSDSYGNDPNPPKDKIH